MHDLDPEARESMRAVDDEHGCTPGRAQQLDPPSHEAATFEREQGLSTICPTKVAIDMLEDAVRESAGRAGAPAGRPGEAA